MVAIEMSQVDGARHVIENGCAAAMYHPTCMNEDPMEEKDIPMKVVAGLYDNKLTKNLRQLTNPSDPKGDFIGPLCAQTIGHDFEYLHDNDPNLQACNN